MSFSSGFSSGLQLGNSIKQDRRARAQQDLDKAMQDWRVKQAGDELELNKSVQDWRVKQAADDLALRREELAGRTADRAADNERADQQFSASRQDAIMGQLNGALETGRKNRLIDAQIEAMRSRAAGLTGSGGDMTTTTEELDPETGEVLSTKRTTRARGAAPAVRATPATPTDPTARAAQERIALLEQQNAKDRVNLAENKDPYWFTNPAAQIAKRNTTIGQLKTLTGRDTPRPAAPGAPRQTPTPSPIDRLPTTEEIQAYQWAQANPNDPRAAAIMKKLQAR